jgi:hypothetical protein
VAPVDKLSVALVILFGGALLGKAIDMGEGRGRITDRGRSDHDCVGIEF